MKNDQKKLREYLACYGSDIESWPADLQGVGFQALRHPTDAALFEEEKRFEQLLNKRPLEAASSRLADRIIAAAYSTVRFSEEKWQFTQFIKEFNPVAIAATLIIGFTLGFGLVSPMTFNQHAASTESYLDEDGATL